jgi:ATP-dependent helicase/nuclease subunit B
MARRGVPNFLEQAAAPRVFSIDGGRPFLDDLADGLIEAFGEALPGGVVFLPTRRAVRAASEAMLAAHQKRGRRAALLPRFRAIGDVDEDELATFAGDAEDELGLPPALSPVERRAALARLVAARDRAFAGRDNWPAALAAARELGRLLDSLYAEEVDPREITRLDVADMAGHWKRSLEFLGVVIEAWPAYLEERGAMDPAQRRACLIDAAARRIAARRPDHPLVIAGTTASAPAVARLVKAIAEAPRGAAVLPGFDRLDGRGWEAIDDPHPQAGMKALLGALSLDPGRVAAWPGSGGAGPRRRLLAVALRPAAATDDWLSLVESLPAEEVAGAVDGLSIIEADNEEAEAAAIAALFREALEIPDQTAMLVTPDRTLARRVALKMRRWDIAVEDSAGIPLENASCGLFLRLIARFLEDPADPVALLALLRHPLADFGLEKGVRERAVDALDRTLRGPRRDDRLEAVAARMRAAQQLDEATAAVVDRLADAAALFPGPTASFAEQLRAHVAAAERLSPDGLWRGADGAKAAEWIAEMSSCAEAIGLAAEERYSELFDALLSGPSVRPQEAAHPRLAILGPLEARLLSADRVILGGLNEGTWPAGGAPDPFLSRPMRRALGLPSPERRVGLSAHDFLGLAAQPRAVLTRAKREGGKPAVPSRWFVRLRNILAGAGALERVDQSARWRAIVESLDRPRAVEPAARPRPAAGPGRRPQQLSVTGVEQWLRDPYAIYAKTVLRLRRLDPPGAPIGDREIGSLLHKVFERAASAAAPPSVERLRALFESEADSAGLARADRRFWAKSFEDAFRWFVDFDAAQRAEGDLRLLEAEGAWTIPGVEPPFTLTARADRIDIRRDGEAFLTDYKLRRVPSDKQAKYFSPQLALTGAVVEAGGFADLGAKRVAGYAYQRIIDRKEDPTTNESGLDGEAARAAIAEAAVRLTELIAHFDSPSAVYHSQPHPEFRRDFGDYDQLARRKEWGALEDEGGE